MVAEPQALRAKVWTYDDLLQLDDEKRYELHDGELFEMPGPSLFHQLLLLELASRLREWCEKERAARIFLAPFDMMVAPKRVYQPDLALVFRERYESGERIEREDGQCLLAPPDLIVEILSPGTSRRDRVTKLNAYASFGVTRYWLLSPDERTLQAFALEGGRYFLEAALTESDILQLPAFPNLQIALSDVFASAS